jgi:O-antigen ligase
MICYLLAGYSFIAIIMFYHDNTRVLWQEKLAHIDDLTGFFFNRNSFATLIGMGIISTLALLVHKYHKSLASNRVVFFNTANIYLLLGLLVQISAIMLTNSRAGILTTLIGVLTVIALYGLRGRFQQMKKVFLLLLIIAPIILLMGQSKLISRLTNTDLSQELRPVIWQKTLQGIAAQPVFGHGLGNFRYGFSPYHDTTLKMKVFRAHNDYLELFFEMGLFAPFLLFWVFFCIVKRCFNGALKRNKHQLYSIIACGVSSQIALHSLVDFSLQIPAVAIFALIIIAIGYSQSYNTKSLLSISRS